MYAISKREIKAGDELKMDYRIFRNDVAKNPSFEEFLTNYVCDPSLEGFVPVDMEKPDHIEF